MPTNGNRKFQAVMVSRARGLVYAVSVEDPADSRTFATTDFDSVPQPGETFPVRAGKYGGSGRETPHEGTHSSVL